MSNGWRQYKLNSSDFLGKESDDCFIPEDDPVWQYTGVDKIKSITPQIMTNFDNSGNEKARIMREQGIEPGTKEWFKLWFTKPQ
jgi:hypothetical protein